MRSDDIPTRERPVTKKISATPDLTMNTDGMTVHLEINKQQARLSEAELHVFREAINAKRDNQTHFADPWGPLPLPPPPVKQGDKLE